MGGRHVLILFFTTILACLGQEQIKMTLLDIKYSESEDTTGTNRYHCYLSGADQSGMVVSARLNDTLGSDETPDLNPDPPDAVFMSKANFPHWRVTFDEETAEKNGAFGMFGCNASIDGKRNTLVPTVRMRSNADVTPANGLLTQTVNIGDEDVSITMQTTKTDESLRWRKDTVVQNSFNGKSVYTMAGSVSKTDAGVYECHINGERDQAKHGLHLLIVRDCPAYRWGPSSCDQACDECYNGGVCDENSGKCICPAGFMGTNCETACGDSNTFGDDCTLHCSSTLARVDACSNKLFCRPHPAGCRCIAGYKGFDCDQTCTDGTFGASCLQTCNCADGVVCDRRTGSCSGGCPSGWKGDTCQDCDGDRYGDDCTEECHCDGDSCSRMFGWCSGNCFSQWVDMFPPYNCQTGLTNVSFHKVNQGVKMPVICTALQGPRGNLSSLDFVLSRHETNLDINDISSGNTTSTDGETKTVQFLVDDVGTSGETLYCQLRSDEQRRAVLEISVSVFELPMVTTAPRLINISNSTVEIEWDAWDDTGETGDGPVIGYVPYYMSENDATWVAGEGTQYQNFTFIDLSPDTGYSFSVAAVRVGEGGEGPQSPTTDATTLCKHPGPDAVPTDVNADYTSENDEQVNVTWKFQQESIECSTGVDHFTIYYSSQSRDESQEIVDDPDARSHVFSDLESAVSYAFRVTVSTSGGESKASESSEPKIEPGGSNALVISPVILIAILLILIVVGAFLYKRRQSGTLEQSTSTSIVDATRISSRKNNAYENVVDLLDGTGEAATKTTTHEPVYANNMEEPSPILIAQLEDYVKKCNRDQPNAFEQQFELLNGEKQYSCNVGEKVANQKKNRFRNMVAYDHSRVELPLLDDVPDSDYYNANYIKNYGGEYAFIASQGPNRASVADFWRVIWQENVTNIVMLTNLMEKGKDRCIQYWPNSLGTSKQFGKINVHWKSIEQFADYSIRELVIELGEDKRTVLNWHFETWPDMDTPNQPTALIGMTKRVKAAQCESKGHLTVHCSAGIGRTGTLIALYTLMDVLRSNDKMDVFGFVKKMRVDRINMIQTTKQYKFLHDCLLEVYLAGDTDVSVTEFDTFSITEHQDELRKQFQVLAKLDEESRDKRQATPDERSKCRCPSILPEERQRPFLQCQGKSSSSNYINACFVPSYRKRKAFLATQSPLPETVEDFWRMVCDWECPLIVMLNEVDTNAKPCCPYWPSAGTTTYGHIEVELKEEREVSYYHYRLFDVSHAHTGKVIQVHHIQLMMWNDDIPEDMGKLVGSMEKLQTDFNMTKPTVVHCKDGAGRTGVFLTVASERERIENEKKFDVFNRVRQLRESNRNFVPTEEEYYLCHTLLKMDQSETEYGNI